MSTTLQIESFNQTNLRERSSLTAGVASGDNVLLLQSSEGFTPGDIIYIGQLGREGCEKAVIQSVSDEVTFNLTLPLGLPHGRFEPVTSVLGDLIHVYRAANINGQVPAADTFTVLATRTLDPDQLSTFYTDSNGSSAFWYTSTYFNATTLDETQLDPTAARRGDDFGHYASISEIRKEAGFENAINVSDNDVDQQRRAAEAEINVALGSKYTTPFTPVPEMIHTLTVQLAAALLLANAYRGTTRGQDVLKQVRATIKALQNGDQTIIGEDGVSITSGEGFSSWPGEDEPRAFHMGDRF